MREKEGRDTIDNNDLFPARVDDGDEECPRCRGRGILDSTEPSGLPTSTRCKCAVKKDLYANMDRRWLGLSKSHPIEDSILKKRTEENVWITAPVILFRRHLRHVAMRRNVLWDFKVTNDAKLITAWLATAGLQGDIFDPDAVSLEELTLIDLVVPPELLIIILGVKAAKNKEMANVLLETLTHREYENKPTWICDQPHYPLTDPEHRCYSEDVLYYLECWEHVSLESNTIQKPKKEKTHTSEFIDLSVPPAAQTKKAGKMSLTTEPKKKR
jgi:hypothetical protein